MADKPPKKGKLLFKGDKKEKKKKRKHRDEEDRDQAQLTEDGWVRVDGLDDLVGPVFITHPSDPTVCLTVDENDRFLAYPLPEDVSSEEPMIVNQVFVGARSVGSTQRFTFKSYLGKFLSSDKVGVTRCDREAISGPEEWEPVITEAGVAFQNTYGKFMMVDQVANGGFKIRTDAEEIGFCETFRVFCQARFKYKRKKESKEKKFNADRAELDNVKKNQSWGGGKLHMTREDSKRLKKAKAEGRMNEAMLDRRSMMKADRYCK
ncbi:FRG1-like family-domain-containing protein [Halteromyces radiatus]|uniref:FRG1-like family-domain-containing protein n=1 Tax=Halteromyces radiatus TaxID=101107 RepID=UPI00221F2A29|nr:FRG1-like family-domain-containing protein [Halteromyces radiatus]KAI8077694.1 FRG1-like family-domain-containing protein [Halteromyces radiatus]